MIREFRHLRNTGQIHDVTPVGGAIRDAPIPIVHEDVGVQRIVQIAV